MLYDICYWRFFFFSFLKVTDEQNSLHIKKYGDQNLACWCLRFWLLWTVLTCCCPLSWLSIWLRSGVVDPCFISLLHIYEKTPFCCVEANNALNRRRVVGFWSTVSKRYTHFVYSFLIDKCSGKMVNTLPFDIYNSSAISYNFNLRSVKRSLWSFLLFSGITD